MPSEFTSQKTPTSSSLPGAPLSPRIIGRGCAENPANRFERISRIPDPDHLDPTWAEDEWEAPAPETLYLRDHSRTILARNQSPDVGFDVSLNPYRGCEHGCVYCYARPSHETLGFSSGLDFETRIVVKESAPALLRDELSKPSWQPRVIGMCGVTDPYQPIERRLGITRGCLEVLSAFRNPVMVVTKNALVTRDIDVLTELAAHSAISVNLSITTLDLELHRAMEPRASPPGQRLRAIELLARAGIPVGVLVAPVIPSLNEHEIPSIIQSAADAGACFARHIVLRLPHAVKSLFEDWLERHYTLRKHKVLNRIRDLRGGKLNDPRFGSRMRGEGIYAEQIQRLVEIARRRAGIAGDRPTLSVEAFRSAAADQLSLF